MSNNKRPLVPSFLQKLDDNLLRNKPAVWQTRTHLVLFFAIAFAAVLSLFCFLVFFDARQYSTLPGWITFTSLIVFIGFVFWLIYLLRFNVFKRFGNWHLFDGLKSFALFFVCIGIMLSVCFIPSSIQTLRANQQFGNEEVVNDINELNATACKLNYNLLPLKWVGSKYKVVDSGDVRLNNSGVVATDADTIVAAPLFTDTVAAAIIDSGNLMYDYIDTAELSTKLFTEDSVVKVNDSVYVFYTCPNYRFVSSYRADEYTENKMLSSEELYRTVLHHYKKNDRQGLEKRMKALKEKWAVNDRYDYNSWTGEYDVNDSYENKIKKKYDLFRISNGIDNAVDKKYEWKNNWEDNLRVFYYITLVFTLLVFIFRHSTAKTFFLSLLTAVVFAILTGLFMLLSYNESEISVLSFIVVYYVVFGAIALSTFGATARRAFQGIAINLFVFMTPFIPLVFVGLNEAIHYRNRYNTYEEQLQIVEVRNTALYFLIAEIAGIVMLLVLLELLFKKLYRKWFAAPEN